MLAVIMVVLKKHKKITTEKVCGILINMESRYNNSNSDE